MANQRDIRNRIQSIKNTRKITSTMEMIATVKMKKMQSRLEHFKRFDLKLTEILNNLLSIDATKGKKYSDPLLNEAISPSRVLIFEIVGNRGLCGGFNSNIIKNTARFKEELLIKEGKEVSIYSVGKKGMGYYAFTKQSCYKSMFNPDDSLSFKDATDLGEELKNLFLNGEFHEVYLSYSSVLSQFSQKPEIVKLLPISPMASSSISSNYIFEPDPDKIFSHLLPLFVKMKMYTCFLETSYSEFFARRTAMKDATDASSDMINDLTVAYNRARQAKITNEILEVIGGAAGLG